MKQHHNHTLKPNESIVYLEVTETYEWKAKSYEYQDRKGQIEKKKKQEEKVKSKKRQRDNTWYQWGFKKVYVINCSFIFVSWHF